MSHSRQPIRFVIGKHKLLQNLKLVSVLASHGNCRIAISALGLLSSLLLIALAGIRGPFLSEGYPILCLFSKGGRFLSLFLKMLYKRIDWVVQSLDDSLYLFDFTRQ